MGRRLGQHYLSRKSILDRIARAACAADPVAPFVIEIGPGKGALTRSLLDIAPKLAAIEVDPYLVHYLRQKFGAEIDAGRFDLIEGDILKTDLAALIQDYGGLAAIAGNLPYYITSPILERLFSLERLWTRAVFLVQSEVAERVAASPGTRAYGYLSVLTQIYSRPEILFEVPRAAFHPPPKVDSAVIRLEPRNSGEWNLDDQRGFLRFAAACFRQKRKTLRNNLATLYGHERVDVLPEGRLRAEQVSVAGLIALYRNLEATCPAR